MTTVLKKTKELIMLTVLASAVISCQKATFLKVDKSSVNATIEGTSGDINVSTDGKTIKVVHSPQWVKVSLNEEKSVLHYDVTLNTDRKLRKDSIVLECSDLTCAVHVTQTFKATYIKFDKDTVNLPIKGGTIEVNVEVDASTPLRIDNHDIAKIDGRKIIISLPANRSTRNIEKTLKVSCDDISADIKVIQEANVCRRCGGEGFLKEPCPECGGVGIHMCCNYTGRKRCPICHGSGLAN